MTDSSNPAPEPGDQPGPAFGPSTEHPLPEHPLAGTITIGTPTRGITLRRWWIVGATVFILLLLGVNLLYWRSTQTPVQPNLNTPDRVTVFVNPYGIIPVEETIKNRITVSPPESLQSDEGLTQPLTILLLNEDKTLSFAKGTMSLSSDTTMIAYEASYEKYPLDEYVVPVAVMATTTDAAGVTTQLPVEIVVWGKFPGWRVMATTSEDSMSAAELAAAGAPDDYDDIALADINVSRNGSTMSIVVLLLISMIVLSVIALVVARSVSAQKRRIEATMASWFAALLFAMVPLRTNMPGAPPIGVWIDFLVFLWVLLTLMVALAVFVGSWLVFSPAPESRDRRFLLPWVPRREGGPDLGAPIDPRGPSDSPGPSGPPAPPGPPAPLGPPAPPDPPAPLA